MFSATALQETDGPVMSGVRANMKSKTPSFRGASKASEPGIHNHHREYGFPDVQLHIGE
jgi:hypothetical protein